MTIIALVSFVSKLASIIGVDQRDWYLIFTHCILKASGGLASIGDKHCILEGSW
jgi:hypothetical protein